MTEAVASNGYDTLVSRMQAWGVPTLLKRLGERDLLIVDAPLLDAIEDFIGASLPCRTLRPAEVNEAKNLRARRTYVFTLKQEWALVARLRREFPRSIILSVQYDLGPAGALRPVRQRPYPKSKVDADKAPIIILSSPGSDAEYLVDLMQAAGLGNSPEYLGQPLVDLLPLLEERFHLPRYMNGAVMRQPDEGAFQMLVQTDVLDALFEHKVLTPQRFLNWLETTGARVIYFVRRDKLMQAGVVGVLADTSFRSIWRMQPAQRKRFESEPSDFAATNRMLNRMMEIEAELEAKLDTFEYVKMLTLEDLVAKPELVLKDIAQFLGRSAKIGDDLPSYAGVYRSVPKLLKHVIGFRHELIDRLGLHINEAGSMQGMSDGIFKGGPAPVLDAKKQARRDARKAERQERQAEARAARKRNR